jgi:DNA processing protein
MSKVHWVALATAGRVGGKTITALLQRFAVLDNVFDAPVAELERVPGVGPVTAQAIVGIDLVAVEAACDRWEQQEIAVITWQDRAYPPNLLLCDDAPPVLFVRGVLRRADWRAVAVIGTRQPKPASAELAHRMGFELARRGWAIVSGLALGIDAAAHRGALDAGGRTLAVLGSGLLRIYPNSHTALADSIARSGALLSELHPEATVNRQNLIARNRITSGLSRAVIVVQSGEDSGSVSTVRRAWAQGRAVLAVTGEDAGGEALLAGGAEPLSLDGLDWDALSERLGAIPGPPSRTAEEFPARQPRLL